MNKLISILIIFLSVDNIKSNNIKNNIKNNHVDKIKINIINKDFSSMMNKRRDVIKLEKNLTNDDYIIKHTYNNTKLKKKKILMKVQEYLLQIKEHNDKIDDLIYKTHLETYNYKIKNIYTRHKNIYNEKEL